METHWRVLQVDYVINCELAGIIQDAKYASSLKVKYWHAIIKIILQTLHASLGQLVGNRILVDWCSWGYVRNPANVLAQFEMANSVISWQEISPCATSIGGSSILLAGCSIYVCMI